MTAPVSAEPKASKLARLRMLSSSSVVGGDIKWLLAEYDRQTVALERINMTACYASEEDTSAQPEALLQIGKLARGEEVPGWPR